MVDVFVDLCRGHTDNKGPAADRLTALTYLSADTLAAGLALYADVFWLSDRPEACGFMSASLHEYADTMTGSGGGRTSRERLRGWRG